MKLTNINEIKQDGLDVFMPSGIQATLFREGKEIIVKYYNLREDKYNEDDFNKLIAEGIFLFSEQPTIPQQSVLMESLNDIDIDVYLATNDGDDREYTVTYYIEDKKNFRKLKFPLGRLNQKKQLKLESNKIFSNFKSLCIIPFSCKYFTPNIIC